MRRLIAMAVFALSVGALTASATAAASPTLVSINIIDNPRPVEKWGYAPGNRKVPVGTWVTWNNDGTDAHSVTAMDGSFDSGILNPSEGFSLYFDQDGTFTYVCSLHDWMTGKIVVGTGVAPEPPAAPIEEPAPGPDPQ